MLKGTRVELIVSDPWDWGTVHGCGPFGGEVVAEEPNGGDDTERAVLVRLDTPLVFESHRYEYFVVEARNAKTPLDLILNGEDVPCCMTRTTAERARSAHPCDLSWWRGGGAMMGSIRKASATH